MIKSGIIYPDARFPCYRENPDESHGWWVEIKLLRPLLFSEFSTKVNAIMMKYDLKLGTKSYFHDFRIFTFDSSFGTKYPNVIDSKQFLYEEIKLGRIYWTFFKRINLML